MITFVRFCYSAEDRFLLLPLPDDQGIRALGIAVKPSDPDFYYVG
ncbi:MAG: hypothetical protein ABTQ93_08425 [Candidatus Competibacter denitrificans]